VSNIANISTKRNRSTAPDRATQLDIYRCMALIAYNDEAVRNAIRANQLQMPYYSPRGQEVIPAAISVSLNQDDYICTGFRGTHDMLAKGIPLRLLWAEMAGKVTGACKGKGGPMHITHPQSGIMLATGVVGATMPIANGLAWASKLSKDGRVTVAYFGDGASNIGAFHESLNLASAWKLPVLFVCQNNQFAANTRFENFTSVDEISRRADGYAMPGITVDGNNPLAMYSVAIQAIDRARAGDGPTLIEAITFRFHGHVFGYPEPIESEEETAEALARDPLPAFRARLIAQGIASEKSLSAMEAEISSQINDAIEFAFSSENPPPEELIRDVYANAEARP